LRSRQLFLPVLRRWRIRYLGIFEVVYQVPGPNQGGLLSFKTINMTKRTDRKNIPIRNGRHIARTVIGQLARGVVGQTAKLTARLQVQTPQDISLVSLAIKK
jgi:hypothetical protein